MSESTYIVRIYRQAADNTDELVGLVETVETKEKIAFKNAAGLFNILTSRRKRRSDENKGE